MIANLIKQPTPNNALFSDWWMYAVKAILKNIDIPT